MSDENDKSKREYEVGYGRPPKHTQPQRDLPEIAELRRKKILKYKTLLEASLARKITVLENGHCENITIREALVRRLVIRLQSDLEKFRKEIFNKGAVGGEHKHD